MWIAFQMGQILWDFLRVWDIDLEFYSPVNTVKVM